MSERNSSRFPGRDALPESFPEHDDGGLDHESAISLLGVDKADAFRLGDVVYEFQYLRAGGNISVTSLNDVARSTIPPATTVDIWADARRGVLETGDWCGGRFLPDESPTVPRITPQCPFCGDLDVKNFDVIDGDLHEDPQIRVVCGCDEIYRIEYVPVELVWKDDGQVHDAVGYEMEQVDVDAPAAESQSE